MDTVTALIYKIARDENRPPAEVLAEILELADAYRADADRNAAAEVTQ